MLPQTKIAAFCNQSRAEEANAINREIEKARFRFESFFYHLVLWLFWIPILRRRYFVAHHAVYEKVSQIVQRNAPGIIEGIQDWQGGFDQWERGNRSGYGSPEAITREGGGKNLVANTHAIMQTELSQIRWLWLHFSGFKNPLELSRNPYPGILVTELSSLYVESLKKKFSG